MRTNSAGSEIRTDDLSIISLLSPTSGERNCACDKVIKTAQRIHVKHLNSVGSELTAPFITTETTPYTIFFFFFPGKRQKRRSTLYMIQLD